MTIKSIHLIIHNIRCPIYCEQILISFALCLQVIQIGFNVGLNYRGYNYNPLTPSQRLLNYEQARRFTPNRYLSVTSSKSPASDSDQSDSEDESLEDFGFRKNSEYNSPFLRQNEHLKYNTVADNSASLELSPAGELSINNYADVYRSLNDRNRADEGVRRAYLRDRLPAFRRGRNHKFHQKEESDVSIKAPAEDKISRRDHSEHKPAAPPEDKQEESAYFQSLLTLMERPNSRRDEKRRYRGEDDDNISFESSPYDNVNVNDHNRRSPFEADLDEPEKAEKLLTNIEVPENRRVNLKQTVISRPFNYEENSDSLRPQLSPIEPRNNRRRSKKGSSLASDKHLEMLSPEKDGPDAYFDTVLLLSGDGKPDDIAVARPQLRNSKASNIKDSDKPARKKYEDINLDVLSNDNVDLEDKSSKALPAIQKSRRNRRKNKPVNNSPKKDNYRRNYDDENARNAGLSPNDESDNKQSILRLENENNLASLRKSYDEKARNSRRNNEENASPLITPNDRLDIDNDNAAFDLSELLVDGIDDLQILPTLLRSNGLSNLNNDKNDYKLALNVDKVNAEVDSLSNLSILRSLSVDKGDLEQSALTNPESKSVNNNKNPLSDRRVADNVGVEVVLTDKLDSDDNAVDELVPYHESRLRGGEPSLSENVNRRENNDVPNEIPLNSRRSHDDLELSVVSLPSLDNQESLKNDKPLSLNRNEQITRRNYKGQKNIEDIIKQIFGTNPDAENSKAANLRKGHDENSGKNSILYLEYPWTNALSTDNNDKGKKSSTKLHPLRRTDEHPNNRVNVNSRKNNADRRSERPSSSYQNPYHDKANGDNRRSDNQRNNDQVPYFRKRNSNRKSNSDYLRVLPLKYGPRNDDASLDSLENGQDSHSYLRNPNNFDDNQSLRVLSIARTNETNYLPDTAEDTSSYITFPIDRRPHLRLRRKKNDDKRPAQDRTPKRRAFIPETNTDAPKADVLSTTEATSRDELNSTAT